MNGQTARGKHELRLCCIRSRGILFYTWQTVCRYREDLHTKLIQALSLIAGFSDFQL
jgi:hypothetical protein